MLNLQRGFKYYNIMKKHLLLLTILNILLVLNVFSQTKTVFNGEYRSKSLDKRVIAKLHSIEIYDNYTKVTVALELSKNVKWLYYYSSSNTYIKIDEENKIPIIGFELNGKITTEPFDGNSYWYKAKFRTDYLYTMVFESAIPPGITNISIIDDGDKYIGNGPRFIDCKINNPKPNTTEWDEFSIRKFIDENDDEICGIYDGVGEDKLRLGCIKKNGEYKLIYLGEKNKPSWWHEGDLKAELIKTATYGLFKAKYYMKNTLFSSEYYVTFTSGAMKINSEPFIKMYPIYDNEFQNSKWTGTGFAIHDKYIVTNHHVANGAKTIEVFGVNGDFKTSCTAKVIAFDKTNDLAILEVNTCNLGKIPYNVKTDILDVGENIFVLGYPETTLMGEELKVTTGIISAKTGFNGDVSSYYISAPTYQGNSGSPLFDDNGNVIGIIKSGIRDKENVNYAVKALYLKNLIESSDIKIPLQVDNTIANLPLSEKVKKVRNYVYLIKCSGGISMQSESGTNLDFPYTITNPIVTTPYAEHAEIKDITFEKSYTSVTIGLKNGNSYYSYCNVFPDTYIAANGKRYTMTKAEGINIAPEKTYFSSANGTFTFTLYFPSVESIPATMDLVVPGDSDWKFFGINIR